MVGFPSTGKRQNKRNLFKIGGEARSTVYIVTPDHQTVEREQDRQLPIAPHPPLL